MSTELATRITQAQPTIVIEGSCIALLITILSQSIQTIVSYQTTLEEK